MKRVSGDILGSLVEPGTRRTLELGIRIRRVWERALGESLARVLRPSVLSENRLRVQVASSAWLMEARFLEPRLLRALREALPDVELGGIDFELAPGETRRQVPGGRPVPPVIPRRELGEDERSELRTLVREIRDPELREGLMRFFEKATVRGAGEDEKDRLASE